MDTVWLQGKKSGKEQNRLVSFILGFSNHQVNMPVNPPCLQKFDKDFKNNDYMASFTKFNQTSTNTCTPVLNRETI